jgi:hypothetical protein
MSTGYSVQDLLGFLDYEREKGLVKEGTISAYKAAANAIFGILDAEESQDLRMIDLERVVTRFANLNSSKFTPDSLKTYRSRATTALSDFLAYKSDPIGFKPGLNARTARRPKGDDREEKRAPENSFSGSSIGQTTATSAIPIPIRPDLAVRIVGLPSDLTKREASKIAKVVMAMAQDDEE